MTEETTGNIVTISKLLNTGLIRSIKCAKIRRFGPRPGLSWTQPIYKGYQQPTVNQNVPSILFNSVDPDQVFNNGVYLKSNFGKSLSFECMCLFRLAPVHKTIFHQ